MVSKTRILKKQKIDDRQPSCSLSLAFGEQIGDGGTDHIQSTNRPIDREKMGDPNPITHACPWTLRFGFDWVGGSESRIRTDGSMDGLTD